MRMPHGKQETDAAQAAANTENGANTANPGPLAGARINWDTSGTPLTPLDTQFRCVRNQDCGLKYEQWSGVDRWTCPVCQYETFEQVEAQKRAEVAGIKLEAPKASK